MTGKEISSPKDEHEKARAQFEAAKEALNSSGAVMLMQKIAKTLPGTTLRICDNFEEVGEGKACALFLDAKAVDKGLKEEGDFFRKKKVRTTLHRSFGVLAYPNEPYDLYVRANEYETRKSEDSDREIPGFWHLISSVSLDKRDRKALEKEVFNALKMIYPDNLGLSSMVKLAMRLNKKVDVSKKGLTRFAE